MKRKFKLISSIASLTAAVALLAVGVFAASTRQFNVNGTVNFTSSLVDATVSVQRADGAGSIAELTYESVGEAQKIKGKADQGLEDVDLGAFTMDDDRIYIGYKVSIKNDDVEKIYVRITVPAGKDALTALTPDVTGATIVNGSTTDYEVASGDTLVVTFTFQLNPDTALVGNGQDLGINSAFKLASTPTGFPA